MAAAKGRKRRCRHCQQPEVGTRCLNLKQQEKCTLFPPPLSSWGSSRHVVSRRDSPASSPAWFRLSGLLEQASGSQPPSSTRAHGADLRLIHLCPPWPGSTSCRYPEGNGGSCLFCTLPLPLHYIRIAEHARLVARLPALVSWTASPRPRARLTSLLRRTYEDQSFAPHVGSRPPAVEAYSGAVATEPAYSSDPRNKNRSLPHEFTIV
ncbi:hypothetical protein GQ54DRAFT_159435 [Martensiomyces pterosporus]|nr:hypothetical protein GQ54DRAFT_159435 [Martensiomyces pterosporus]